MAAKRKELAGRDDESAKKARVDDASAGGGSDSKDAKKEIDPAELNSSFVELEKYSHKMQLAAFLYGFDEKTLGDTLNAMVAPLAGVPGTVPDFKVIVAALKNMIPQYVEELTKTTNVCGEAANHTMSFFLMQKQLNIKNYNILMSQDLNLEHSIRVEKTHLLQI
jgi:hypothetical protein